MKKEIELAGWNRREHFAFFSRFEEPYFGLVLNVDVTIAYQQAKARGTSFFLYYLYQSMKAVNAVEAFRYRIESGKVYCYDTIHASPTISREDGTFGFSFIAFSPDYDAFVAQASEEIAAVRQSEGLGLNEETGRLDVVHYSAIPWISFTGLTHARSFTHPDSVPKISFGKYFYEGEKLLLPVAIYGHHGLLDAYHVAQYLDRFQGFLNQD